MGTTDTAGGVAELAVVSDVLGTRVTAAGADVADIEEAMLKHKQCWSESCDKAGDAVGIVQYCFLYYGICAAMVHINKSELRKIWCISRLCKSLTQKLPEQHIECHNH